MIVLEYVQSILNQTNLYYFLQVTRVHALLLSVSFTPISDDFTLVIDMLALSAVFILPSLCRP